MLRRREVPGAMQSLAPCLALPGAPKHRLLLFSLLLVFVVLLPLRSRHYLSQFKEKETRKEAGKAPVLESRVLGLTLQPWVAHLPSLSPFFCLLTGGRVCVIHYDPSLPATEAELAHLSTVLKELFVARVLSNRCTHCHPGQKRTGPWSWWGSRQHSGMRVH